MLLYNHMCLLIWTVFSGERCGPWASCSVFRPNNISINLWMWNLPFGCWWMSVIVHCCCCFCKTPAFDDEENDPGKITTTHLPQPYPQLEYIINSTTTTHPISPQPIIPPTLICGLILPLHPPNLNVNPSPFLTWWGIGNCYHRNLEFVLIFLGRNDT